MTAMADTKAIEALHEALEDEYNARATYRKVIEVFGPVRPFVNIVEAEERHTRALLRQFDRLGVRPPEDTWPTRIAAPQSVSEACEAAVQAEIDNAAMYERLIAQVSDPAVRQVMRQLEEASQRRHLPAFKRCLSRKDWEGSGPAVRARGTVGKRARGGSRG
jgi:rubrerythrin